MEGNSRDSRSRYPKGPCPFCGASDGLVSVTLEVVLSVPGTIEGGELKFQDPRNEIDFTWNVADINCLECGGLLA